MIYFVGHSMTFSLQIQKGALKPMVNLLLFPTVETALILVSFVSKILVSMFYGRYQLFYNDTFVYL